MHSLNFTAKLGRVAFVLLAPVLVATSAYAQDAVPQPAPEQPPAAVLQPEPMEAPAVEADRPVAADEARGSGADTAAMPGTGGKAVPDIADVVPAQAGQADTSPDTLTLSIGELVGKTVVDAQGEKVGIVTDVKKTQTGDIQALHVRTSGFFGFGAKTLVVPSDAISETEAAVKLNLASAAIGKLTVVKPKS